MGTFSGIGTSPVILLGNQALASLSKFPESRKVEYFSDLVVSGWPMIFKDLLSIICGQDFLSPYKTRRYLEGTKRNPGKIISRFPCLDLFFLSGRLGRNDFARSERITWLFACFIY